MPRDLDAEPRAEDVLELYEHNRTAWKVERAQAKVLLDLYWGKHSFAIPDTAAKGRKRRIEPERMETREAARIVNLVHSLFSSPASVGLTWTGEGQRGGAKREALERALAEVIDQLNPPHDSPRSRRVFSQIVPGWSAQLGPIYGADYYWDFPYKREDETEEQWAERYNRWRKGGPLPLLLVDLPPESTFPASFATMDDLVLSEMQVTAWELAEVFSQEELARALPDDSKGSNTFTLGIYSNRKWLAYAVLDAGSSGVGVGPIRMGGKNAGASLLRTVNHDLGRSAIRIYPGMTRRKEHGRYWVSVLTHVAELIIGADKALSIATTAAKFDAFPPLKRFTAGDIEGTGATSNPQHEQADDIWDFEMSPEGQRLGDIEPIIQPRFAEKTQALLAFFLGRTEQISGAVKAMEGLFSAETAWATRYAVDVATNKHSELMSNIIAGDRGDVEMVMRSVDASGEPLFLKRKTEESGEIKIVPGDLGHWVPVLTSNYKLRMPVNKLAAWQTGVSIMERSAKANLPLSPETVMEEMLDIEQPWEEFERAITWRNLLSPPVMEAMNRRWLEEAEIELGGDEGIGVQEFLQRYQSIPPEIKQAMVERAAGGGGGGALGPAAKGAARAGSPFSSQPGGPQPEGLV